MRVSQRFFEIFRYGQACMIEAVKAVVGSIVENGALTRYAWFESLSDKRSNWAMTTWKL